jgi:NADPH:quinone reductase-like Zn-dependent oxidoreductase
VTHSTEWDIAPHGISTALLLLQGVGTVEALGEGASKFKEGQRVVCGAWSDGTWCVVFCVLIVLTC